MQPLPRQSSLSNRRKRSEEIIGVAMWRLWNYKGIGLMGLCSMWKTCLLYNKSKTLFAVVQILRGGSFLCHGSDGHEEPEIKRSLAIDFCEANSKQQLQKFEHLLLSRRSFSEEKKNTLKAVVFSNEWYRKPSCLGFVILFCLRMLKARFYA